MSQTHTVFRELLRAARACEPAIEPTPTLHALAYVLVLEAVDEREALEPELVRELVSLGEDALARAALVEPASEDDEDFLAEAVPLARAGLALLSGKVPDYARLPRERVEPSPVRLLHALRGELPGVEAGRLAARFLARGDGLLADTHRLRARLREPEGPVLRLAAAPAAELRDPREGARVFLDEARGVEIVYFDDDATVGVYTDDDVVTLVGDDFEPLVHERGYLLARVTGFGAVTGEVEVRGERLPFSFSR
ncbi:MAG: hypothetical protein GXY23_07510 [Myxococcales bacterium]|nr:hypothetical protein [Myxococcales bacterium]